MSSTLMQTSWVTGSCGPTPELSPRLMSWAGTSSPSWGRPASAQRGDHGIFFYLDDPNFVFHGFLRASNGTLTTFDAPGAGTGLGEGTFPSSINPSGAITGIFSDPSVVLHGFLYIP